MIDRRIPLLWSYVLFGFIACDAAFAQESPPNQRAKMPRFRVDATDFNSSEQDIHAVCASAGGELWRHFEDYDLEPFVVVRGREGPISLYKRNDRKEIVVRLDTGDRLWAQFAYQFAHEFCHVLCGLREGPRENLWFEETLCETASLYALRGMARSWKEHPPYRNWSDFRDHLREYADDSIRKRTQLNELHSLGLAAFYEQHAAALRADPINRELNGTMAVPLLHFFEEQPVRWEAIRWLNKGDVPKNESFEAYLTRWQNAAPEKHRDSIQKLAALFGRKLPPSEAKP